MGSAKHPPTHPYTHRSCHGNVRKDWQAPRVASRTIHVHDHAPSSFTFSTKGNRSGVIFLQVDIFLALLLQKEMIFVIASVDLMMKRMVQRYYCCRCCCWISNKVPRLIVLSLRSPLRLIPQFLPSCAPGTITTGTSRRIRVRMRL